MGDVQGKLTFRVHNGVIQASADGGATWSYVSPLGVSASWAQLRLLEVQAIAPTLTNVAEYNCSNVTQDFTVQAASGTAVTAAAQDVPGGGIKWSTGTTNGSGQLLLPVGYTIGTAAQRPAQIDNMKTSPWAVMTRMKVTTAVTGDAQAWFASAGDAAHVADIVLAVLGADDTTHLELWINGGGPTKLVTNLVPTFDAWCDVGLVFDGSTLWGMLNGVKSSAGITDLTNMPATPGTLGRQYYYNGTTGADKVMRMSRAAVFSTGV
jgi:hypothetical protein